MNATFALHVGLSSILLTWCTAVAEQPEGSERVLAEAISAWDQFAEDFAITRLVLASEVRRSATAEFRSTEIIVKRCQNNRVVGWDTELRCINDNYGFELRRAAADKPWTLTSLVLRKGGDELRDFRDWFSRQEVSHFFPLAALNTTLNKLARHRGFSVKRVGPSAGEPNLVELDFEIDDHLALIDNRPIAFKRGRLTLDRSRSWMPVRRELVWLTGVGNIHEMQSFKKEKGVEYPSEMRSFYQEADGSTWLFGTTSVKDVQIGGSVPDREFTLSYFGIPEPVGSPRRFPPYLWLAAAAVVMIILGMLLRARARARSA